MIKRIVQKTGISEDQGRQAVSVVINYLKERLPAPIAAQVDTLSVDKIRGIKRNWQ